MWRYIRTIVVVLLAVPSVRADEARPASPAVEDADSSQHPDVAELEDDSRLLLAPAGRPLRRGSGYVSGQYVASPFHIRGVLGYGAGARYGLTDNVSIGGGVSEGRAFLTSQIAKRFSDRVALSAGLSYGWEPYTSSSQSFGYVVATLGGSRTSLTAGAGVFRNVSNYFDYQRSHTPAVFVGGQKRLFPRVALVSENWLVFEQRLRGTLVPMGLSLRFSGKVLDAGVLTADLGLVTVGAFGDGVGAPHPWFGVSYHFGGRRRPGRL